MTKNSFKSSLIVSMAAAGLLSGCLSTAPSLGGGQGGVVTGAAAGRSTYNANKQLARCARPLGTIAIYEDTRLPWWAAYQRYAPQLGSTVPVIRLMIQQSGCFVVVERGAALRSLRTERALMASGEMRRGSNFGKGKMVAADYTLKPSIQFAQKGTGGAIAALGGLLGGRAGSLAGSLVGGLRKNEAASTLLLIDNRSGVQVSSSVGSAKNMDLGLGTTLVGRHAGGGLGAFGNTPQGRVVTAAFADAFNQMVKALPHYRAQEVKGGLGKGGSLRIGN